MVQPMARKLLDADRSLTVCELFAGGRTHLPGDSAASRQLKDAKVSLVRTDPLIVLRQDEHFLMERY